METERDNAQQQLHEASQIAGNLRQVQAELSLKEGEVAKLRSDLASGNTEREYLQHQITEAS